MKTAVFSISVILAVFLTACSGNGTVSDEAETLYNDVFYQVSDSLATTKPDQVRSIMNVGTAIEDQETVYNLTVIALKDGRQVSVNSFETGARVILIWNDSSPESCAINLTSDGGAFLGCSKESIVPLSQKKREELLKEIQMQLRRY